MPQRQGSRMEEAGVAGGSGLSPDLAGDEETCLHTGGGDKVVLTECYVFFIGFLNPRAGHQGRGLFAQLEKRGNRGTGHSSPCCSGTAVGLDRSQSDLFPGVRLPAGESWEESQRHSRAWGRGRGGCP